MLVQLLQYFARQARLRKNRRAAIAIQSSRTTDQIPVLKDPKAKEPLFPASLLNLHKAQLHRILQLVHTSENDQDTLILFLLNKCAEHCQIFPSSRRHHHSYEGGALAHTLDVVALALGHMRSIAVDDNAKPHERDEIRFSWTLAVVFSAIAHDAGKQVTDITVKPLVAEVLPKHLFDITPWNPLTDDFCQWVERWSVKQYTYTWNVSRAQDAHTKLGKYIAMRWLQASGVRIPSLFYVLLASADGDDKHALNHIITRADSVSVKNDIERICATRPDPVEDLFACLEQLVHSRLWHVGSDTDNVVASVHGIYLLYPKALDELIQSLISSDPIAVEQLPSNPAKLRNLLVERGDLEPSSSRQKADAFHSMRTPSGRTLELLKLSAHRAAPLSFLPKVTGLVPVTAKRLDTDATTTHLTSPDGSDDNLHIGDQSNAAPTVSGDVRAKAGTPLSSDQQASNRTASQADGDAASEVCDSVASAPNEMARTSYPDDEMLTQLEALLFVPNSSHSTSDVVSPTSAPQDAQQPGITPTTTALTFDPIAIIETVRETASTAATPDETDSSTTAMHESDDVLKNLSNPHQVFVAELRTKGVDLTPSSLKPLLQFFDHAYPRLLQRRQKSSNFQIVDSKIQISDRYFETVYGASAAEFHRNLGDLGVCTFERHAQHPITFNAQFLTALRSAVRACGALDASSSTSESPSSE